MSEQQVFLVGGGWSDEAAPATIGGFADAVRARAGSPAPRVRLVVMGVDEESLEYHEKFVRLLGLVGLDDVQVERVAEGNPCPLEAFDDVDGIFVGGGPTPEYHASLRPCFERIRALVADGVPYAGFSAGAAIAATRAVVGGWLLDGVPVCPEESNEDLDEVRVVEGLGLVDGAVDVHASQWGNLSRLVAVVAAGHATSGLAIDECTTYAVHSDVVTGLGAVWRARTVDGATTVHRLLAEPSAQLQT